MIFGCYQQHFNLPESFNSIHFYHLYQEKSSHWIIVSSFCEGIIYSWRWTIHILPTIILCDVKNQWKAHDFVKLWLVSISFNEFWITFPFTEKVILWEFFCENYNRLGCHGCIIFSPLSPSIEYVRKIFRKTNISNLLMGLEILVFRIILRTYLMDDPFVLKI